MSTVQHIVQIYHRGALFREYGVVSTRLQCIVSIEYDTDHIPELETVMCTTRQHQRCGYPDAESYHGHRSIISWCSVTIDGVRWFYIVTGRVGEQRRTSNIHPDGIVCTIRGIVDEWIDSQNNVQK